MRTKCKSVPSQARERIAMSHMIHADSALKQNGQPSVIDRSLIDPDRPQPIDHQEESTSDRFLKSPPPQTKTRSTSWDKHIQSTKKHIEPCLNLGARSFKTNRSLPALLKALK